jgi:endonuclease YncB( thermonuclease family)
MRRRRIFRPAPGPRRLGTFALGCAVAAGAVVLAVALPGDLFGSAPREQSWTAAAPEVRVLDGDALRLGDRVLRLAGLAVPDRGRATCPNTGSQPIDCAAAAAAALARLVQGRDVECRVQGRDRHGRALGTCQAGGVELNGSLVAAGWALAEATAPALAPLEAAARQGGRGLWGSGTTPPEQWRQRF